MKQQVSHGVHSIGEILELEFGDAESEIDFSDWKFLQFEFRFRFWNRYCEFIYRIFPLCLDGGVLQEMNLLNKKKKALAAPSVRPAPVSAAELKFKSWLWCDKVSVKAVCL